MKPTLMVIVAALTGLGVCVSNAALFLSDFTGTDPGLNAPWNSAMAMDNPFDVTSFASPSGNDSFEFVITPSPRLSSNLQSAVLGYSSQVSGARSHGYASVSSIVSFSDGAQLQRRVADSTIPTSSTFGAGGYNHLANAVEFGLYGFGTTDLAEPLGGSAFSLGRIIAPVPEPAEWGLICVVGLAGVCGWHTWRERRRASRQLPNAL